jgi:hypothetical protein
MPVSVTGEELREAYWGCGETLVSLGLRYGRSPGTVRCSRKYRQAMGI